MKGDAMDSILQLINEGMWEKALEEYLEYTGSHELDDKLCIMGATILEKYGEYDDMYELICHGLKLNPENYELYLLLGNYYAGQNVNKAYLSYENALFYANRSGNEEDSKQISEIMDSFLAENEVTVNKVSVILLEDMNGDSERCREYLLENVQDKEIQIVTGRNEMKDAFGHIFNSFISELDEENDILLLSNDVCMLPNALFNLRMELYSDEKNGACGAILNNGEYYQVPDDGNERSFEKAKAFARENNLPDKNSGEIAFALDNRCSLFKREALSEITPLDEDYKLSLFLDHDICLSLIKRGYASKACHNSYVFSTVDKDKKKNDSLVYANVFAADSCLAKEKWGFWPDYYSNSRVDLIEMITDARDSAIKVLEVGAGLGATLSRIKRLYPKATVKGIEIVERVAEIGSRMINMECGNIENYEFAPDEKYDYILFGDVLEHLVDPYKLVDRLKGCLSDGGCIIASIPNIMNAGVIYELLHGNFTYQDSGILDRTHLRFFTLNEIKKLFTERGYEVEETTGINRIDQNTQVNGDFWEKILAIDGVADRVYFDVFQFLVRARKTAK